MKTKNSRAAKRLPARADISAAEGAELLDLYIAELSRAPVRTATDQKDSGASLPRCVVGTTPIAKRPGRSSSAPTCDSHSRSRSSTSTVASASRIS